MPHMSDMGFACCSISECFKPVDNEVGVLDKEATNHDDLFDSFRLLLWFWHRLYRFRPWFKSYIEYDFPPQSSMHSFIYPYRFIFGSTPSL